MPRHSTGIHDPLECAALYLRTTSGSALFLANDLIYFTRDFALGVRQRIADETSLPLAAILVAATHTRSGPVVTSNLCNATDPAVPRADTGYLAWLADRLVATARAAIAAAEPADVGLARAIAEGVGSNRHDPGGPTDPDVPVLVARSLATGRPLGCMVIYGMHPTVLHEDSKLISADFPGFARRWLRGRALPESCPVLYHQGAAGNQSPRHVTRANTFAEAQRIGEKLGQALAAALGKIEYRPLAAISSRRVMLPLVARNFPGAEAAQDRESAAGRALLGIDAQALERADPFGDTGEIRVIRAMAGIVRDGSEGLHLGRAEGRGGVRREIDLPLRAGRAVLHPHGDDGVVADVEAEVTDR